MADPAPPRLDFIREIIRDDLASGKHDMIVTRFPPEPNGHLHIGHAKAICLNFGIAEEHPGARCHLRFDDTNPVKEEQEFVDAIIDDVRWLGFQWDGEIRFASDYFPVFLDCARHLIREGLAYIDEQNGEIIRRTRGTLTEPGTPSPFRDRPADESLSLFEKMVTGDVAEGAMVVRARIDMAAANIHLRDPVIYRVLHAHHHHAGGQWHVYPLYDFAHPLEDAIEGITHSLCTLEFEEHRPLYDWFVDHCAPVITAHRGSPARPRQIEFARLNLGFTVMSKRLLARLVQEEHVRGWDDPRMPTLSGLRRRGVPAEAIREFCQTIGITKTNSLTDIAVLEHATREVLNRTAPRFMAVLDPLRVVLTNWDTHRQEVLSPPLNPEDPQAGSRAVPFARELFIDRADFMEDAPRKFFRLKPGGEVRLRHAWIIRCDEVVKDDEGRVVELRCSVDHDTLGKNPEDRKVKGVIHWVPASAAVEVPIRLYDRLFLVPTPGEAKERFTDHLNPESLVEATALVEPALAEVPPGTSVQFERTGYFFADPVESQPGKPVFNRTAPLRDSWAKQQGR